MVECNGSSTCTITITDGANSVTFLTAGNSTCYSWGAFGGFAGADTDENRFMTLLTRSQFANSWDHYWSSATGLYKTTGTGFTLSNSVYMDVTITGTGAKCLISAVEVMA
jgi:hypothetical protein